MIDKPTVHIIKHSTNPRFMYKNRLSLNNDKHYTSTGCNLNVFFKN